MRKLLYSLTFAFVLLLAGAASLTAFDEPGGGGTVPAYQMWLPVVRGPLFSSSDQCPWLITDVTFNGEPYPAHSTMTASDSSPARIEIAAQFYPTSDADLIQYTMAIAREGDIFFPYGYFEDGEGWEPNIPVYKGMVNTLPNPPERNFCWQAWMVCGPGEFATFAPKSAPRCVEILDD